MKHHYADDGRILTPPSELEPQLRKAFPAFIILLGHIRFFYIADELWDGESLLTFIADDDHLADVTFQRDAFRVYIANEDFLITDESMLDTIILALKKNVPPSQTRPVEQRTVNLNDPDEYHCGYRCDMCLVNEKHRENEEPGSQKFDYMNWLCYHNCVPNISVERYTCDKNWCPGCKSKRNECGYFICPTEKGYANCAECGDYRFCDVHCNSHYPGQCNLGLTASEVTSLVIPYSIKERLDTLRDLKV